MATNYQLQLRRDDGFEFAKTWFGVGPVAGISKARVEKTAPSYARLGYQTRIVRVAADGSRSVVEPTS